MSAEELARQFHEIYERLAPFFGYETRTETRAFDPTTPNGRLMIAVCGEIDIAASAELERLRGLVVAYFAAREEYYARFNLSYISRLEANLDYDTRYNKMEAAEIALRAAVKLIEDK